MTTTLTRRQALKAGTIKRELLTAAAKAVGMTVFEAGKPFPETEGWFFNQVEPSALYHRKTLERWAPLDDNAQAFRLALAAGISVEVRHDESQPLPWLSLKVYRLGAYQQEFVSSQDYAADPEGSARRAIVAVAAKLGKAMP